MTIPYTGFYINLDQRTDRRLAIENELIRTHLNHAYTRFPAIDGKALKKSQLDLSKSTLSEAQCGCFISHYLLLKENLDQQRHLHVIEDDTQFGPATENGLRMAIDKGWLQNYDIVFTDTYIPIRAEVLQSYKALFDQCIQRDGQGNITHVSFGVANLKHKVFATTNSFLINRQSIRKLHDIYSAAIAKGLDTPIDLFIRELCNQSSIAVGVIFPFITSIHIDNALETSIDASERSTTSLAEFIARQSFFIGCNWERCTRYIQEFLPLPPVELDKHRLLLKHVLAHVAAESL